MITPAQAPKLTQLADACNSGACNLGGLLRSLGEAANELPHGQAREHPAIKVILGHLSYLASESIGPTSEALHAYDAWKAAA